MENNKTIKGNNFYTYGMIKPDAIINMKEIIKMIYDKGLEIHYMKLDDLTSTVIDENYAHCIEKEFYPEMKESLLSGPVLKMLIYDPKGNAVYNYRKILGSTKSWEADEDTIRGRFGNKKVAYKNAAHGSGSIKEANTEIIRFFKDDLDMMLNELRLYVTTSSMQSTMFCLSGFYSDRDKNDIIESRLRKAIYRYSYIKGV